MELLLGSLLALSIVWNVVCFIYTIGYMKKTVVVNKADTLIELLTYEKWLLPKEETEDDY